MSIFKDTFKTEIQTQLEKRQNAIFERTPNAIHYLNSRNAWIRMSSSVNVNGSNVLASKYILQGGVLNNGNLRSGVGKANEAYSSVSPGGTSNRLGIRPMPGITGIDVKSKSAYGSLREVEVKFNAWDIRQLEELELLYMRPGYTVLIEWGWLPYLDNSGNLRSTINFYDIINKTPTKEQIFKDLYDTAVKTYSGNYDAMFGYIKNYSWAAREDGGYDCSATVISVGEVIESIKVNYAPFNTIDQIINKGGIFKDTDVDEEDLKNQYSVNILAGLFYEIWSIGAEEDDETAFSIEDKKSNKYTCFRKKINIHGGTGEADDEGDVGASDVQVYITLESLCTLINNNVTFIDSNSKSSYVTCSVFDREYDKSSLNQPDPTTGNGGYLLCLGHPLQISMDPTICLINNSAWAQGMLPDPAGAINAAAPPADTNVVAYTNTPTSVYEDLIKEIIRLSDISDFGSKTENELIEKLSTTLKGDTNEVKQLSKIWFEKNPTKQGISLYDYLDKKLVTEEIERAIGAGNIKFTEKDPSIVEKKELEKAKQEAEKLQQKTIEAAGKGVDYLATLNPFFYNDDSSTELGIIGNIYVNVNYLYRLAVNDNLEAKDSKEKNDISLYDFLKSMLSEIGSSIGNVNNFEIHVDPIDNVVRIIDINYVDKEERDKVYKDIFTLQMHNTKSTVRSYKLESQIFPDQSATVAIGAQVGGGALATDNNTMLDFNKGLEDRIIPKKLDPTLDPNQSTPDPASQLANLSSILDVFYGYFQRQDDTTFIFKIEDADYNTENASKYKNALRDLINFYKNLTKSDTKNRSIIPTKLSITLDGIGGLIIGHMFKIPEELLPKGYKGEGNTGSKLGYIVTGIGHSISNNDWTTEINAQTIILDNPGGNDITFSELMEKSNEGKSEEKTKEGIKRNKKYVAPSSATVKKNLDQVEKECIKQGITNRYVIIALKANIIKETGGIPKNEDLAGWGRTAISRIRYFFTSRVKKYSDDELRTLSKDTVKFADTIYGKYSGDVGIGFGNNKDGDGYTYRGRSYIGITGKKQYAEYSQLLKQDFLKNPDSMNTPENAAATTVLFIKRNLPAIEAKLRLSHKTVSNQLDANLLITSVIAGRALRRNKEGEAFEEILDKVDSYSTQLTTNV